MFWAILKTITFHLKTALATFWATFGKIGLLVILTPGYTEYKSKFSHTQLHTARTQHNKQAYER